MLLAKPVYLRKFEFEQSTPTLFRRLAVWRQRVRGRAELARFSARDLKDIGLNVSDAHMEINKPFWRA